MTEASREFYDKFATKLARDFVVGNPRAESAISFACSFLKKEGRRSVLDLGCGIGWSTYEFSRACPGASVHGLDLSSNLIALAKRMFAEDESRQYFCGDLTARDWAASRSRQYDACVMLDVYEHLPKASRSVFHEALSSVMTGDAVIVLTCPSPLHQAFLRNDHPEGLQPTDEDVFVADIQMLAEQTGADLVHFQYKSVWATNDYFDAALARNVRRKEIGAAPQPHRLCRPRSRRKYVQRAAELLGAEAIAELTSLGPSRLERVIARFLRTVSPERLLQPPRE